MIETKYKCEDPTILNNYYFKKKISIIVKKNLGVLYHICIYNSYIQFIFIHSFSVEKPAWIELILLVDL